MPKYKVTGSLAGSAKTFTVEATDDVAAFNQVVSEHPNFEMQQVSMVIEEPPSEPVAPPADDQPTIEPVNKFQDYVDKTLKSADKFVVTCDTFIGMIRAFTWLVGGIAMLIVVIAFISSADLLNLISLPLIACFTFGVAEFQVMFLRFMREVVSLLALRNRM